MSEQLKDTPNKETIRKSFKKNDLISQTKIIDEKLAILLGKYFVCEKLAKYIIRSSYEDEKNLNLMKLKKTLSKHKVEIDSIILDTIFCTSSNNCEIKSLRNIRNEIVHNASLASKDLADTNFDKYNHYLDIILKEFYDKVAH
ncbi:MAG: hypothetical protein J1F32_03090 [Erysipelotrichales bacterium]|nr:hypothetical protein [Erysipelotrichales bacterium]